MKQPGWHGPGLMLGKLNHIAIVVPDLASAADKYRTAFSAEVSESQSYPEHGVTVAFVDLPNTRIELMEPLGENSPVNGYLKRNPDGGIHHICLEVDDIDKASSSISKSGIRLLGDGKPKIGAHGKPVLFLHPKDCNGTLIEFEEA